MLEQQGHPKLTKMAWEGSGCGMRSCVLVSASWRARNLARPDTWQATFVLSEDQTCHAMAHIHYPPLCKSLVSVLRGLVSFLERTYGWIARLVRMAETKQTLMCSFGFCAS